MSPVHKNVILHARMGFILPALSVLAFSFFLHQQKWLGLVMLASALVLLLLRLQRMTYEDLLELFAFRACRWHWTLTGAALGIGLGLLLRWDQDRILYPSPWTGFIFTAILIGITEELIFRGYFMGLLLMHHVAYAASTAALLHTVYKLLIFVPYAESVDFVFLGTLTFAVGTFAGWTRKILGSIWPCVAFHALFDLWVYGDRITPWWVW